jgi:hypothetical protein
MTDAQFAELKLQLEAMHATMLAGFSALARLLDPDGILSVNLGHDFLLESRAIAVDEISDILHCSRRPYDRFLPKNMD